MFGYPKRTAASAALDVLMRGVSARTVAEIARRMPATTVAEMYGYRPIADPSAAASLKDPELDAVLATSVNSPAVREQL
jgi:hypothetical protein